VTCWSTCVIRCRSASGARPAARPPGGSVSCRHRNVRALRRAQALLQGPVQLNQLDPVRAATLVLPRDSLVVYCTMRVSFWSNCTAPEPSFHHRGRRARRGLDPALRFEPLLNDPRRHLPVRPVAAQPDDAAAIHVPTGPPCGRACLNDSRAEPAGQSPERPPSAIICGPSSMAAAGRPRLAVVRTALVLRAAWMPKRARIAARADVPASYK